MDEIDDRLSQGLCPKCKIELPKDENSTVITCKVCQLEMPNNQEN